MRSTRNTSSGNIRAQPIGLVSKLRAAASDMPNWVTQAPRYMRPPRFIASAGLGDKSGKGPSARERAELPLGLISAALCLGAGAMLLYAGSPGIALPLFLAASILAGMSMLRLLPSLRRPAAERAERSSAARDAELPSSANELIS